jgi:hypothetical protein
MPSNPFEYASGMRDKITAKESQEIQQMYVELGKKIDALGKKYGKKDTASAPLQQMYYTQLKKQVEAWSKELSNGVYSKVTHAIGSVSDAVVKDNAKWLESLGFNKDHISAAFSNVNQSVVNSIVTGKIYGGKSGSWSLSKSIWGDNEKNLKTIYRIVAEGMAMQMGVQEIAENLRDFVDPTKKLDWTGPDGIKIYGRKTDYNAQRLVRTLSQHAYQKSVSQVAWDNPFISKIKWIANGSRVCEICKKRNGKVYALSKLPLDHPNGMCVMDPVVDDDITDQLADWVKGKEIKKTKGIDKFADLLGYDKDELAKSILKTPNKPEAKPKAKPKNNLSYTSNMKLTHIEEATKSFEVDFKNDIAALKNIEPKYGVSGNELRSFDKADADDGLKLMLKNYWGSMKFETVNKYMRNLPLNEDEVRQINKISKSMKEDFGFGLDDGLKKMKTFIGKNDLDGNVEVFRYIREANDVIDDQLSKVGNEFTDNAFVSTVKKDQGDGKKFIGKDPAYKLHILVPRGKGRGVDAERVIDLLRNVSNYYGIHAENEMEFTLQAGTKFRVEKIKGKEVWLTVID